MQDGYRAATNHEPSLGSVKPLCYACFTTSLQPAAELEMKVTILVAEIDVLKIHNTLCSTIPAYPMFGKGSS